MKTILFINECLLCLTILFCTNIDKSVGPTDLPETGFLKVAVHTSPVGALGKSSTIELSNIYIQLYSPGLATIYDTLSLSGGSFERSEQAIYSDIPARIRNNIVEWTLSVESRDQNDMVIHSKDTVITIPPRDTLDLEVSMDANYSMLKANFYPIRDSVTGCVLIANGEIVGESYFAKQSILGDTVILNYDYLQASPSGVSHTITMNVYGDFWGIDTLLYTGDTTINILSGKNESYKIKLKNVTPGILYGTATMMVTLGEAGTVLVEGELEDTVATDEIVTDIDGNEYHTVQLGDQVWMVENLKVTRYNDGTPIPLVTVGYEWTALTTPAYCWFNNDSTTYCTPHGAMYNWYVVDSNNPHKIAPEGWHVPSDEEWTTLENYLIATGYNYDGTTNGNKIAKSMASTSGWISTSSYIGSPGNDPESNNSSGFSAFPSGNRLNIGLFDNDSLGLSIWSSTNSSISDAWRRMFSHMSVQVMRTVSTKTNGYSVRCLKN